MRIIVCAPKANNYCSLVEENAESTAVWQRGPSCIRQLTLRCWSIYLGTILRYRGHYEKRDGLRLPFILFWGASPYIVDCLFSLGGGTYNQLSVPLYMVKPVLDVCSVAVMRCFRVQP